MEYSVKIRFHEDEEESSSSGGEKLAIMGEDLSDATDNDNGMQAKRDTKHTDLTPYEGKDDDEQFPQGQKDDLCSPIVQKQVESDSKILKTIMQLDTTYGSSEDVHVASEQQSGQSADAHSQSREIKTQGDHQKLVHDQGQGQMSQDQIKGVVTHQEHIYNQVQGHDKSLVQMVMQQDPRRCQRSCSSRNNIHQAPVEGGMASHTTDLFLDNKTQDIASQALEKAANQNQNKNQTPPLPIDQFRNKENHEFVFFSWKDAKELITLSWHLGHCSSCRGTFQRWKSHAIKMHGAKPSVQKVSGIESLKSKILQQRRGVLTRNRTSNHQTTSDGNASSLQLPKRQIDATSKSESNLCKPSSPSGQYNCGLCNLQYKTEPELRVHLKVHADQKIAFKCQKCDRIFLHQTMLQRHMANHSELKTTCKICGRKFPDARRARRHRYTHGKKIAFKCEKCSKTYTSMQSLRIHQRTHTGDGMMPCKFCGKKFPSKFSLTSHERIHTGEKPYKCLYCNEHFKTHSSMRYHEQLHTGFRYMCQHCGKGYRDRSNLREHERTHTGEKPFKCDGCPKTFTTAALLKYHRRLHTGESYECKVCKKHYRSRGILNKHMKSHSDERPFICHFCGKGFREKATLKTHEKGVHLGVKFTCKLCKREFTQKSALKTHEKGVHSMHGHDKTKKSRAGDAKLLAESTRKPTSNPTLHQTNMLIKDETSSAKQPKGTEHQIEQEYLNSTVIPLQIRQDHTYDSAAPHYPMSTSDFHTMVDSLIQFSKDH